LSKFAKLYTQQISSLSPGVYYFAFSRAQWLSKITFVLTHKTMNDLGITEMR